MEKNPKALRIIPHSELHIPHFEGSFFLDNLIGSVYFPVVFPDSSRQFFSKCGSTDSIALAILGGS
jgi:hypothetical protein